MLLTIKPTSRLPNKYWQKPMGAVTVTPSIITCSRCFSLRFQLPPQTASRDVTLSIKLDQNSLVSGGFLCRLDCLIMWRWRRSSAKPAVTSLKGDMLTRARFLRLLFFSFFALVVTTQALRAAFLLGRGTISLIDPFKQSPHGAQYDRPPAALLAISLIMSTFTLIIMWSPPSSHSLLSRCCADVDVHYWSQSTKRDLIAQLPTR